MALCNPKLALSCQFCKQFCRVPLSGPCKHLGCKSCWVVHLATESSDQLDSISCTVCRETFSSKKISLDHEAEDHLKKCSRKCGSCDWGGSGKDYQNHERVCGNVERIQCKKFGCGKWLPKSRALEQHKEDEWCPMIHLIRTYEEDNKNPPLSIQMPLDSVINLVLGSDQKRVQQLKELMQYIFHRIDASGLAIANKGLICVPVSDEHQAHDETRPESHSTLGEDVWCEYAALQARFSFIAQSRDVVMHSSLSSAEKRLLLDGINQELQGIVEVIGLLLSRCQKLEARILDLECSHSGVFLWKIDNYSQRKKNAATTNVKSIYSMPFFTSQYGYKLCGRVFLMGDGVGKETHISLFLTIMRGPHDAVLPWPFKQKIIFQLVNQDDPLNKSIVEAFRPDPTSSSFKRPTSDRNIGAGCPLFAKIQLVEDPNQGFLKDDTLHLKIISQTSDVPELK